MNLFKIILTLSLLALVLMLSACQGDGDAAPVGSKVVIAPSSVAWTYTVPADNPDTTDVDESVVACDYNDHQIIVNVNDPSGAPLGKTDLLVTLTLAGHTTPPSSGEAVMQLYDDVNNNYVIDAGDIEVTAAGMPGYVTDTDNAGVKLLLLRVYGACVAYKGYLAVYASGANISSSMEVTLKRETVSSGS